MGKSSVSARPADYSQSAQSSSSKMSSGVKKSTDASTAMNPPQAFARDPSQAYVKADRQEYPYYASEQRPRGDSIYLPPPVTSYRFVGEYDQPQNQSIPLPSRSNSIFSALIQFPNSGSNSVSEPSKKGRQMSVLPNQEVNYQDIENYFNKESLGNLLAWQNPSRHNSHDAKSAKSKGNSIDLSNPALWESLNSSGGSIAGLNSGSLAGFLAGIQNGSIDFTNMSEAQRRDSLLRLFSDPNNQQIRPSDHPHATKLREDMFYSKTPSVSTTKPSTRKNSEVQKSARPDTLKPPGGPEDPLSPTSSLSSKSSKYKDVPHSPKTSPASAFTAQFNNPPSRQQQQPGVYQNYQQLSGNQYQYPTTYQTLAAQPQSYNNQVRGNPQQQQYNRMAQQYQAQPQFISPNFTNFQAQQQQQQVPQHITQMPPSTNTTISTEVPVSSPSKKRQPKTSARKHVPAVVSPPVVPNADKPVIGATKIDQLMLVIQSRDQNNDLAIRQNEDGEIVGQLKNKDLIGGIDKHKLEDFDDGDKDSHKKKKKKLPQCPYCYKYFAQSTQLEVHVRSHIGYKPFECSYCHKRFTQGGNLTTHLRLHTGEKPFTCDICNRSFSRKGNLAAHKLTHENAKPFECKLDGCDKSFTQLGNLKAHQNKFHLNTLNDLTQKLATLSAEDLSLLPKKEKELLDYFKSLYKNSNKGIKGRGKRDDKDSRSSTSPPSVVSHPTTTPATMRTNYSGNNQYSSFVNNNYRSLNPDTASMINDLNYHG